MSEYPKPPNTISPEAGDKPVDNVDNPPWWVLHPEFDTIEEYWAELDDLERDDD